MASINIPINNGTGSQSVANGNYNVTVTSVGYDASTLNPSTINVVEGTNDYSFTVGATGTLTIHVSDDGTTTGNPIVGAVLYRTDSDGTTYGDPITTDAEGNAVLKMCLMLQQTPLRFILNKLKVTEVMILVLMSYLLT